MTKDSSPTDNVPHGDPRQAQFEALAQSLDPFGISASFAQMQQAWLTRPVELTRALSRLALDLQGLQLANWQNVLGQKPSAAAASVDADERFADPAWSEIAPFALLKQYYLAYTHWLQDTLYETPGVADREKRRATFWVRQWLNAVAPSNYFLTNPVAIRKFWESGGRSLADGLAHWLDDLRVGDVQMVDRSGFKVGVNLANTPGAVVFRNELVEVIHYAPSGDRVHALPLVIIAPWINKFYILDLNERKSLVRYLLGQGFSVFITSWRNPPAELAGAGFDDYLVHGALAAIEAARSICDAPQVHAVGYCLGGTALAALMAWLNREYPPESVPVAHWTLLTTLVDFSRPGAIEVFIDANAVATLERMMARQGYLDGREMGRAFRLLRSNSLIWYYFVHGYLYGETPPAFDVLFWNTDVTRLPKAMHSFYLREFYLDNKLMQQDGVTLAGHPIDLGLIRQPLYAVGAEEDHIAPWKATFSICDRIPAPVRYTLSSSGHILGIINPPVTPPKRSYWSGEAKGLGADRWRERQQKVDGSWWEDWVLWLKQRCGPLAPPPPLTNRAYRGLAAAPGGYVLEL